MGSVSFPSNEMRRLASFERRIEAEGLTLGESEEIEEELGEILARATTDKTRGIAVSVLNRLDAKKGILVDRAFQRFTQASGLDAKINSLIPLMRYLTPAEVDEKLNEIQFEASLCDDPKVRNMVEKKLNSLRFAADKPLINDLKGFVQRLGKVSNEVLRKHSLTPMLKGLSKYQVAQVQHAAIAPGAA